MSANCKKGCEEEESLALGCVCDEKTCFGPQGGGVRDPPGSGRSELGVAWGRREASSEQRNTTSNSTLTAVVAAAAPGRHAFLSVGRPQVRVRFLWSCASSSCRMCSAVETGWYHLLSPAAPSVENLTPGWLWSEECCFLSPVFFCRDHHTTPHPPPLD